MQKLVANEYKTAPMIYQCPDCDCNVFSNAKKSYNKTIIGKLMICNGCDLGIDFNPIKNKYNLYK